MTLVQPDPTAPSRRPMHPLLAALLLAAVGVAFYAMYLRWSMDPAPGWTRFANPVMFLALGVMHLVHPRPGKHYWVIPALFLTFGSAMLLDALFLR